MDESIDQVDIAVELQGRICYISQEKEESLEVEQQSLECALSDYFICKNNQLQTCKFIDCFTTNLNPNQNDRNKNYLFSACIPKGYNDNEALHVCDIVAQGNYYVDYMKGDEGESIDGW